MRCFFHLSPFSTISALLSRKSGWAASAQLSACFSGNRENRDNIDDFCGGALSKSELEDRKKTQKRSGPVLWTRYVTVYGIPGVL